MNKKILALAIPNIVSNISVPLVSAVDTMLMGHIDSAHLASLGIVSMIFVFIYGIFNFLRMGTTGLASQAFGRQHQQQLSVTLYRAVILALFFSLLLLLLSSPIQSIAFYLMNVDTTYSLYAQEYFDIRILTAPAVLLIYVFSGWFFGVQNSLYPLYITLVINVINIIASLYFVNVLHLGIRGAAYGTLIAQYSGLFVGLLLLRQFRDRIRWYAWHVTVGKSEFIAFLHINKEIFIRTLTLTTVFAFFYAEAAKLGEETLSIMVILMQFIIWYAYSLDGFANAAESLVGRYYGANDWLHFNKSIRYLFYWAIGFSLFYTGVYFYFTPELIALYTNQTDILEQAKHYTPYIVAIPLVSFAAFMFDGIFIGMTAIRTLKLTILYASVLFLAGYYLTKSINPSLSLWINFLLFFLFRGLIQAWFFNKRRETLR